MKSGDRVPEWHKNRPEMPLRGTFFLNAYWELSTTRTVSRIPWDKIIDFAERKGLDEEVQDLFLYVIRELEREHAKWQQEQRPPPVVTVED